MAHFSTPADLVYRLLILPTAVIGVLFPSLSAALAQDQARGAALIRRSARAILAVFLPVAAATICFAEEGLALWVDAAFAAEAGAPLRWLAAAILLNGIATVPAVALVSVGRPEWKSIPVIVEAPFFIAAVWAVLQAGYGPTGVAIVYAVRMGVDFAAMAALCGRFVAGTADALWSTLATAVAFSLAVGALSAVEPAAWRGALLAGAVVAGLTFCWVYLLDDSDRSDLGARIGAVWERITSGGR